MTDALRDGDFTVQHSSDLKLKLNRGRNFLASAGKVRGKARRELEQWGRVGCPGGTCAFEKDARIPAGKHPPCSPISCVQTAMLFRVNRLIQLQRLEGFCSGARAHTPRLRLEGVQGWKALPERVMALETHERLGTGGLHGNHPAAATRGRSWAKDDEIPGKTRFQTRSPPFPAGTENQSPARGGRCKIRRHGLCSSGAVTSPPVSFSATSVCQAVPGTMVGACWWGEKLAFPFGLCMGASCLEPGAAPAACLPWRQHVPALGGNAALTPAPAQWHPLARGRGHAARHPLSGNSQQRKCRRDGEGDGDAGRAGASQWPPVLRNPPPPRVPTFCGGLPTVIST